MVLKLKNGFLKMSDPDLASRSKQILESMTGNIHFPDPIPTIEDMEICVAQYNHALIACQTGDRIKIAEKNYVRENLVHNLHQWSFYVLWKSNGVEAIALSSGFSLSPVTGRRIMLEKPHALVITNGINQGELICSGKRVEGAVSYFIEYSKDEFFNECTRIPTTRVNYVIDSLKRGALYYVRIVAVGGYNQLTYSDITCHTAA